MKNYQLLMPHKLYAIPSDQRETVLSWFFSTNVSHVVLLPKSINFLAGLRNIVGWYVRDSSRVNNFRVSLNENYVRTITEFQL